MKVDHITESDNKDYVEEVSRILQNVNQGRRKFKDVKRFPLIDSKQCLYVMNWKESKLTYTKGVEKMLGYNKEEFTMCKALDIIHPEDKKIVNRIIRGIINHSIESVVTDNKQYLTITYRLLKKDGTYLKVMRQSSPYEIDDNGKFISNLSVLTDISFMTENEKVEWELYSNEIDMEEFKKNIYKEFEDFFTKRELEIIHFLKMNFSNKQIAEQMHISVHTVATHRKNILNKSKCHNTNQLLDFSHVNGIL